MQTQNNEWVAYALIEGTATKLLRGSWSECVDYVGANPRGPNGGSTHVAHRPLKTAKRRRR